MGPRGQQRGAGEATMGSGGDPAGGRGEEEEGVGLGKFSGRGGGGWVGVLGGRREEWGKWVTCAAGPGLVPRGGARTV